ncbi:MAG: uL15 family ribosomal protein [Patescibacteria group bacterium]
MLIHQIQYKNKKPKRVGRGGKKGTYSGKGLKGQSSRAGRKFRPALRDVIIKLPKKRGYRFKTISEKPHIVNLGDISKRFSDGEKVGVKELVAKKLLNIPRSKKNPKVKILGKGEFDKNTKLIFKTGMLFSKQAKEKTIK